MKRALKRRLMMMNEKKEEVRAKKSSAAAFQPRRVEYVRKFSNQHGF